MPHSQPPSGPAPRVLVAAGGTAGHVVPALAVAAELSASGCAVEFAGGDRIESRLVPEAGYPFHRFAVRGLERSLSPALLRSLWTAGTAPLACRRILREVRPDVVFGAGGYVAGPMLAAARAAGVPAALLEVDAHMGLANRLAVPLVRRVYLAFPIEGRSGGRYLVTGRPVPPPATDVARDPATVLVFGGSLGARRLNDAAAAAWGGADPGFRVVHITGERDAERYREAGRPWYEVLEYTNELGRLLAAATVAVARAGGSVFEVAAAGTPALLVPSPNVTADHQSANARHLERAGAAVVVADADLTAERLDAEVRALLADPARLAAMGEAARAWSRPDAARVIADDLRRLVPA